MPIRMMTRATIVAGAFGLLLGPALPAPPQTEEIKKKYSQYFGI
jgi:hypothetical protein